MFDPFSILHFGACSAQINKLIVPKVITLHYASMGFQVILVVVCYLIPFLFLSSYPMLFYWLLFLVYESCKGII